MAKAPDAAGASVVPLGRQDQRPTAVMKDKVAADRDVTTSTNMRAAAEKAAAEEAETDRRRGGRVKKAAEKPQVRRVPFLAKLETGGTPLWVSPVVVEKLRG